MSNIKEMSGEFVDVYGQSDYTELPDERGPLSLATRTWQWIQWVFLSMLTYATVYLLRIDRRQLRRTAKGVRRSVRQAVPMVITGAAWKIGFSSCARFSR